MGKRNGCKVRQGIGLEEGIIVDCISVTENMTMTVTINKDGVLT